MPAHSLQNEPVPYLGVTRGADPVTDVHFWQPPWVPMDRAPWPGAAPHQGRVRWGSTSISDQIAAGSAQLLALLASCLCVGNK